MLKILQGDWIERLRDLPDESVHCCVTSPPYWGLRDYGIEGQLGLEKTPEEYVSKVVAGFRELRRVLRDDGTLWLNLGDSYCATTKGSGGHNPKQDSNGGSWHDCRQWQIPDGLKPKDLVGIPWRVAFALQSDGWYLRSDIIWHKPNPMPESVTDRPTKAHEYIFLLSKSARYFYDAEAIKEPAVAGFNGSTFTEGKTALNGDRKGLGQGPRNDESSSRNKRSVWTVPTSPYSEAHFATFPPDLIKPCILAGTSARGCCPKCGSPWERIVESTASDAKRKSYHGQGVVPAHRGGTDRPGCYYPEHSKTLSWEPTCDCYLTPEHVKPLPCTVLDPFGGSGTTGQVALELGRRAILIELNPAYIVLAERRTFVTPGLSL